MAEKPYVRCPVCDGAGEYHQVMFGDGNPQWGGAPFSMHDCLTCEGVGYLPATPEQIVAAYLDLTQKNPEFGQADATATLRGDG